MHKDWLFTRNRLVRAAIPTEGAGSARGGRGRLAIARVGWRVGRKNNHPTVRARHPRVDAIDPRTLTAEPVVRRGDRAAPRQWQPRHAVARFAICYSGSRSFIFRTTIPEPSVAATKPLRSSQRSPTAICLRSFLSWPTGSLRARLSASAACRRSGEGSVSEVAFIYLTISGETRQVSQLTYLGTQITKTLAGSRPWNVLGGNGWQPRLIVWAW